jgi:hypothetical protein
MTTHDRQTEMTDSYDEPHSTVKETPSQTGETQPAVPADPATASIEPSSPSSSPSAGGVADENPSSSSVASAEPSSGRHGAAPSGESSAVPVERSSVQGESSTEETLFAADDLADLRSRWTAVQAAFVDDPKDCVQKADNLVSDLVEQLTTGFAHARSRLEEQWARGEEASTEDLRLALMHYRKFFERLLAV